jgi:hypothetical protein
MLARKAKEAKQSNAVGFGADPVSEPAAAPDTSAAPDASAAPGLISAMRTGLRGFRATNTSTTSNTSDKSAEGEGEAEAEAEEEEDVGSDDR